MFKKVHISVRTAYDLMRDPDMVFAHKHYIRIIYITHLIVAIISIEVWLYLLVLPMFITLHCFLIQTCFTHIPSLGYKNYTTNDNSVNSPLLFPIILGEAWHNNHHGDSKNPNYGGRNWWELDPTYWIIKMIGRNNEHKK
jgi:stearoyl-CoA desaturase (delta-9 desaturase)